MWQEVAGPFSTKGLALQQMELEKANNPRKDYRAVREKSHWIVEMAYKFDTGYEVNHQIYIHRPASGE